MSGSSVIIRKYLPRDRQEVRQICCQTAFMGEPCAKFFDGDDIFADALTMYFTDYEPQSCFVAEKDSAVVGYLIGAKDESKMGKVFAQKIALGLLGKALCSGIFLKLKNIVFLGHCLSSALKGEFRQPDVSQEYPATLHINMRPGFRDSGIGSQLMSEYLVYLKSEGVRAVHFATMSENATRFFERFNFQVLSRCQRSYFRHLLNRDITVYIYGQKLF